MTLILPADFLARELAPLTVDGVVDGPDDQLLVCPSVEWLQRFGDVCRERCDEIKRRIMIATGGALNEAGDCDDYTREAIGLAARARDQQTEFCKKGYGFAVGYARITINDDEYCNGIPGDGHTQHATCIVRTPDGWMLFEPQTGDHELLDAALARCCLWAVRL